MTATEWLFKALWNCQKDKFTWHSILEKAKEMEKQQIIKSFEYGVTEGTLTDINYLKCESEAESYYNETFINED